jgi:AcrR family transcriptional regulator
VRKQSELRETILTVAGDLFAENGYAATSIKQIASASGCTNAALYYYFEGGKANILREVVRSYSEERINVANPDAEFADLSAYLEYLTGRIGQNTPRASKRLGWLVLELRNLPREERDLFVGQFSALHRAVRVRLEQYLSDPEESNVVAWIIVCSFLGYGQIFQTLGLTDDDAPSIEEYGRALAAMVSQRRHVET